REALDPLDQHPSVPGAIEDGHPAPAGQRRPEAAEEMVALLVLVGRGELGDADVARVQRRHQPLDRPALAGGVPALEDDHERRPEGAIADQAAERQPQLRQPPSLLLQPRFFLLTAQARTEIDVVKASHAPNLPAHSPLSPRDSSIGGGRSSVVTLASRGKSRAPRKIRITPAATSQ